jgi:carboxyl-terminal processing protease
MSQSLNLSECVAAVLGGIPGARAVLVTLTAICLGAGGQPTVRAASARDELRTSTLDTCASASAGVHTRAGASALLEPGPAQAPTAAAGVIGLGVNGAATFDAAWQAIHDTFVHEGPSEAEWAALRDEFRPRAAAAQSDAALRSVLREMLARLGRSHFDILPSTVASNVTATAADAAHETGDVGLEITPIDGEPVVTRVVASGPADRAGVRPGWVLERVDGHDPKLAVPSVADGAAAERSGFRLWAATLGLLRGPMGTTASLDFRDTGGRAVTMPLTRAAQEGQPVKLGYLPPLAAHLDHRMLSAPGGRTVGYIHFNIWMTPLAPAIDRAVDALRGAAGIIIDLRQNPGGVLTMLMGVSGHFFDAPRSLGTLQTRDSELRLVANPRLVSGAGARVTPFSGRVAILVDDTSYSASEVFAGGMQAAGRARVFGARTPGGALPALMRKLPNGDVLEYAIADFVTASGERIEGHGVVPDEPVRLSRAAVAAGQDAVLDAALRWAGGGAP